jgi:hypothetical protein
VKRKNPYTLHPVERAIAKTQWEILSTFKELHLRWAEDFSEHIRMVHDLMYITGLAAHTAKLVDSRITDLHNACTTAVDCVDGGEITVEQQETLVKGLEAVRQLKPLLPERNFTHALTQATCIRKSGGIFWKDFLVFIQH